MKSGELSPSVPSPEERIARQLGRPIHSLLSLMEYEGEEFHKKLQHTMLVEVGDVLMQNLAQIKMQKVIVVLGSSLATALERVHDEEEKKQEYTENMDLFKNVSDPDSQKLLSLLLIRNTVMGKIFGMGHRSFDERRELEIEHMREKAKDIYPDKNIEELSLEEVLVVVASTNILYPSPASDLIEDQHGKN